MSLTPYRDTLRVYKANTFSYSFTFEEDGSALDLTTLTNITIRFFNKNSTIFEHDVLGADLTISGAGDNIISGTATDEVMDIAKRSYDMEVIFDNNGAITTYVALDVKVVDSKSDNSTTAASFEVSITSATGSIGGQPTVLYAETIEAKNATEAAQAAAETAESNAETSATNASNSADSASTSATNASNSATAAAASETDAEAARDEIVGKIDFTGQAENDLYQVDSEGVGKPVSVFNIVSELLKKNWSQVNYDLFEFFFTSGSGAALNNNARAFARVDTGSTPNSYAGTRTSRTLGWFSDLNQAQINYDEEFWIFVVCTFTETGDGTRKGWFFFGDEQRDVDSEPTGKGIGFASDENFNISSFVHDGTSIQESAPFITLSQNISQLISIRNVGDGSVEYYANGSLQYTENNGPTGISVTRDVISTFAENDPSVVGRFVLTLRDLKILVP